MTDPLARKLASPWPRWLPDALALAGLTVVVAALYFPVLFLGRWMPAGGGDLAGFLYPLYAYAADSLRQGRIPLWNPHLYSGSPFLADIQTAVFYPPNLLLALFPGGVTFRVLMWLSVAHVWLAGALMYACLRGWETPPISRPAALFGALAFALSDLFFTHVGNLNLIASAAWLPLVLLGARKSGATGILLGALGLGLAALAGHTQPVLYILLALGVYVIMGVATPPTDDRRLTTDDRLPMTDDGRQKSAEPPAGTDDAFHLREAKRRPDHGPNTPVGRRSSVVGRRLLSWVAIPVLGLGLAALTLLPAYELTGLTRRAALTYQDASLYALPPQGLIGLVAPHLHGRGPAGFWADWSRVEAGYAGVLSLLLAAVGLTLGRRAVFWAVLAGLGLLLALGPATPLHRLFYDLVPGMSQLRAPARLIYLLDFGVAGLAALGLDTLLRRPRRRHAALAALVALGLGGWLVGARLGMRAVGAPNVEQVIAANLATAGGLALLAAGTVVIALGATRRLTGRALAGLALLVLAVDLVANGVGVDVSDVDPTANYAHPAALAFLQADGSTYRLEVRGESWGHWAPNLSLLARLDDVSGIYNPLQVADYQLYWEGLTDRATRLYDFLNAKYVIGPKDFALPWGKFVPVFDADPTVTVYLNTQALPRVQVITQSRVIPDARAQFETLRAPGFDPSAEVILGSGQALSGGAEGETGLSIARYEPEWIEVEVTAPTAAYVVFSEVFYPGWRAWVDGQPASIDRANFAFRAVPIPAGSHRVSLRFEPDTWRLGLLISVASAVVLVGLAGGAWRRRPVETRHVASLRVAPLPMVLVGIPLLFALAACAAPPAPLPPPTSTVESRVYLPALPQSAIPRATPTVALPITPTPSPTSPSPPSANLPSPIPSLLSPVSPPPPPCPDLVTARDGDFWLDGRRWTFLGTNFTYVGDLPLEPLERSFASLADHHVDVLRIWVRPGYDLDRLAQILDLGRRYGLRFIVTFEDAYNTPRDTPYFAEGYKKDYLPHLRQVVSRFQSHPEIFMWQLMNEPNCGPTGLSEDCLAALRGWAREAAQTVRQIDRCRPLSIGLIGVGNRLEREERHFRLLAEIAEVDTLTLHREAVDDFRPAWRRELGLAREKGMPLVWGEIYAKAYDKGCRTLTDDALRRRAALIRRDLGRSFEAGADGYLLWQFAFGQLKRNGQMEYFCGETDYERDDPVWEVFKAFKLPTE